MTKMTIFLVIDRPQFRQNFTKVAKVIQMYTTHSPTPGSGNTDIVIQTETILTRSGEQFKGR